MKNSVFVLLVSATVILGSSKFEILIGEWSNELAGDQFIFRDNGMLYKSEIGEEPDSTEYEFIAPDSVRLPNVDESYHILISNDSIVLANEYVYYRKNTHSKTNSSPNEIFGTWQSTGLETTRMGFRFAESNKCEFLLLI